MARRPRLAPAAPVTWRDGAHLTGTPIWCDARRRRDVCFVSSAERVGRSGHGQLIGTSITLALLGARGEGHLPVPLRQRFTLGTLRLELIPSGRALGAAALYVDVAGRTALYAGALRTVTGGLAEPAEVRACDALVVEAAHASVTGGTLDDAAAQVIAWARATLARDATPVVVVDSALDAFEVAARLVEGGVPVAASRPIREAAARIGALAAVPNLRAPGREPAAVLQLDRERTRPPAGVIARARTSAFAAGPGAQPVDATFTWPFVATRPQLLAWIEHTRARDVFVTGDDADAVVAVLGPRARVLGPPRQMALFAP